MKNKVSPEFVRVKADYTNPGFTPFLKVLKKPLYRFDGHESRFYYTFSRGVGTPHISITSLADKVLPKGAGFYTWLKSQGKDSDQIKYERAVFGTVFHIQAMRPILGDTEEHGHGYDFDYLDEPVHGEYFINERGEAQVSSRFHMMFPPQLRAKASRWRMPFKKGLMAWFLFLKEKVERIYAVEIPLAHKKFEIAGTSDLVCDLTFNRKTVRSIVDIKSFIMEEGQGVSKSFYDSHEFQLAGLKHIWEINFPEYPIDMLFNWAPNNWIKEPSYTLKNQTDNPYLKTVRIGGKDVSTFELRWSAAKAEGLLKPPTDVTDIRGKMESLETFDPQNHFLKISLI